MIMTYIESGCWCLYFQSFLDDTLVNFKCPRAVYQGCYADPKCPNASYITLVDGVIRGKDNNV
jgi:hypothetical protein